ncbi:MAG: patatin [Methylobacterium sp.]|nr:MAG: patatin [Methylobacterium sp.]
MAPRPLSLALQGGGAHGAFTWGVLDALLEEPALRIEAISGASAGAMNAVALVEGYAEGGPQGAREQLRRFWERIANRAAYSFIQRDLLGRLMGQWDVESSPGFLWWEWLSLFSSPYQSNPLDLNPLRDVLEDEIRFELVRKCTSIRLFISATNVQTGRVTVFDQSKLEAKHVLASACLPRVFRAVEIGGVPYWDGGYVGNPALFPLFHAGESQDILLIQITRMIRKETPKTARAIENRLNEITFNASLMGELRAIEFVQRLLDQQAVSPERYRRLRMHRIDADQALGDLNASSKLNIERDFIEELFGRGRKAGEMWLHDNREKVGRVATLDLASLVSPPTVEA